MVKQHHTLEVQYRKGWQIRRLCRIVRQTWPRIVRMGKPSIKLAMRSKDWQRRPRKHDFVSSFEGWPREKVARLQYLPVCCLTLGCTTRAQVRCKRRWVLHAKHDSITSTSGITGTLQVLYYLESQLSTYPTPPWEFLLSFITLIQDARTWARLSAPGGALIPLETRSCSRFRQRSSS